MALIAEHDDCYIVTSRERGTIKRKKWLFEELEDTLPSFRLEVKRTPRGTPTLDTGVLVVERYGKHIVWEIARLTARTKNGRQLQPLVTLHPYGCPEYEVTFALGTVRSRWKEFGDFRTVLRRSNEKKAMVARARLNS